MLLFIILGVKGWENRKIILKKVKKNKITVNDKVFTIDFLLSEDKKNNLNRSKEATGAFDTKESILEKINHRLLSERKRYKDLYGIDDHTGYNNFDLVIDTTNTGIDGVMQKCIEYIDSRK